MRDFIHELFAAVSVICAVATLGIAVWNTFKITSVHNSTRDIEKKMNGDKLKDNAPDIT